MTLYAMCSLVFLFVVAIVGVGWVVKFDYVQIVLLCLAILLVFLGSFFNSTDPTVGFVGSGSEAFSANLGSEFRDGETFWSCLAVFFPAVTGIMAGANISGDLRDAQVAIPKGTIWAVGVSSIVYLALTWAVGASYLRGPPDVDWGLYMDKLMMTNMSLWAPIVYVGVICATLSSALASLVGAPRVLQAVARDNLFPVLKVFGNGHGVNNEPYEAYLLTVAVATVCIFAGDLNSIAALITNFFLISYTLINYSCFAASFSESPGWRPRFKFFNHYVALLGTLICIAFMFLISWITSLATFFIGGLIYKYIEHRKPDVNWGSAGQATAHISAVRRALALDKIKSHVKNFRPQFLVLTGAPAERPHLVAVALQMAKRGTALVICGNVVTGVFKEQRQALRQLREDTYLRRHKCKAFIEVAIAPTLAEGARILIQGSGLGTALRPNTMVLGFLKDWGHRDAAVAESYVSVIGDAFDLEMGVMIMRNVQSLPLQPDGSPLKGSSPPVGTIDVYWLSDDGGLSILLPYLITQHQYWAKTTLRLLTRADPDKRDEIEFEMARVVSLLNKFRIEAEVVLLPEIDDAPSVTAVAEYEGKFGIEASARSRQYIRIGETVRANSLGAKLVFCTLPVPAENTPAAMYLSWIDTMSYNAPPMILVRGNQQSVLTFLS
eukprot:TRINITY_DN4508_c0_g1_i1.p1 TRINITY_DN4508_c0_g1~~TRINITY_DN4508_c0_g1_i1.p1  ORF type:complete len:665 (-),score=247.85 TRINITY_DN4508_c0_g1_i1:240-2234(-)